MNDRVLYDCLSLASHFLARNGEFFGNVNIGPRKDRHWREFPLVWRPLDFYKDAALQHQLTVSDLASFIPPRGHFK
jgi:hypothetical protein